MGGVDQQYTVLIADESSTTRRVLSACFNKLGEVDVIEVDSGLGVFEALSARSVDLLVVDIELPGMDGLELLTVLRADPDYASLEVLVVTGTRNGRTITRLITLGVSEYVLKPFTEARVMPRLRGVLARLPARSQEGAQRSVLRVLVVDSDQHFLSFCHSVLAKTFEVETCSSQAAALISCFRQAPDIALVGEELRGIDHPTLSFRLLASTDQSCAVYQLTDSERGPTAACYEGAIHKTFAPEAFLAQLALCQKSLAGGPRDEQTWMQRLSAETPAALRQVIGMLTELEPELETGSPATSDSDVFSELDMRCPREDVALRIGYSSRAHTAEALVAAMLRTPTDEIDATGRQEGIGEVLNLVAGRLKSTTERWQIDTVLGLPRALSHPAEMPSTALTGDRWMYRWGGSGSFEFYFRAMGDRV